MADFAYRPTIMRPYRKEKLARIVREVVCEMIAHKMHDPRIDPMTTITRVEMTGDLLIAKVYLTVQGSDTDQRRTLQGIQHASGFLQRQVAQELQIRHCPTLRFEIDHGVIGARRTFELLAENRRLDPTLAEASDDSNNPTGEAREEDVEPKPAAGPPQEPQDTE